jgi:hypothetical protein
VLGDTQFLLPLGIRKLAFIPVYLITVYKLRRQCGTETMMLDSQKELDSERMSPVYFLSLSFLIYEMAFL